jgi:gas vesicle protein
MMHREHEMTGGFAAGIVTGAVVGAGLALLFAPKAGNELRHEISDSMGSLRDAVARRYRQLAETAGVTLEDLQGRVERATDAFEEAAQGVVRTAARAREESSPYGTNRM